MRSANYSMRSQFDGRHDTLFKHAKLQCLAYHGEDQSCVQEVIEAAYELIRETQSDPVNRKTYGLLYAMKSLTRMCEIRKEVGKERFFSLRESNYFRPALFRIR